MNKLVLGDNLEVLRGLESESVDLIYLDPPFFSNRHYECIWGDKGEIRSFEDRWSGGIEHYIGWLKERVQEMHRILKPTGSIYLHCDHHADAYIRVYILDPVFGAQNFVNEIVWEYDGPQSPSPIKFATKHDTIYRYAKDINQNVAYELMGNETKPVEKFKQDTEGRWYYTIPKGDYSEESIKRLAIEGRIEYGKNGKPRIKKFVEITPDGENVVQPKKLSDVWKITSLGLAANSKEKIGYPTQKPEKLLERIILASSNKGDIVLDPFVGGGTTVAVANRLGRQWIGIDQSVQAIRVSENRINNQALLGTAFEVVLHKYDYDKLFTMNPFDFETWIVQQFSGIPNTKQRGDLGLDGRTQDGTPIQVKQSENIGRNVIDNLKSAAERYDKSRYQENIKNQKPVAYLIAFSFGKGAVAEVARLKLEQGIEIVLKTVGDIVPLAKRPTVELTVETESLPDGKTQVALEAHATSESGISFFSWDWDYSPNDFFKPEVQIDRQGKQTLVLPAGRYCLAVKAIDEEGMATICYTNLEISN